MNNILALLKNPIVPVIIAFCIPYIGFLLWMERDILGLSGWKLIAAPLIYVFFGLMTIILFGIVHDIPWFPDFTLQHQGLCLLFPLLFPTAAKWLKKDVLDVTDALAVTIPGVIGVIRIFCIINHCCYGKFFPGTETHIPLREIVMAGNLICCALMMVWLRHKHPRGIMLPAYLVFYGLFRLLEVSLRFSAGWRSNGVDIIYAIVSVLLGLLLGAWVLEKHERERSRAQPAVYKKQKKNK